MNGLLTAMGLTCTVETCRRMSRIGFVGINIFFSLMGAALMTGSCIVCYDNNTADKYLAYTSFQKALESANVSVHTPSSLNIGETLNVVCIPFIVIGVLFLLLGILGTIATIFRLKALLITYAVLLLVLVVLELICFLLVTTLRGKIEGWITDALKDSIRDDYSGITGSDLDTLRWNFIMHSFQCCGVDRYTDFRTLPASSKWNIKIEIDSIVTGKQIPFACCKVKNDTDCVLRPNSSTSFIEKGCYQVMRNWVTDNASVLTGVGASILIIELILVVLAFVICCMLRKESYETDEDMDPLQPYKLPHAHLESRNQNPFNPSDVFSNPVYEGPTLYDSSVEIYPLRQSRELFNHDNHPTNVYDRFSHDEDTNHGALSENEFHEESCQREPSGRSFRSRHSSEVIYAKARKREPNIQSERLPSGAEGTSVHPLQNTADKSHSSEVKTHKNMSFSLYSSNV